VLEHAIAGNAEEKCADFALFGVVLLGLANQRHENVLNNFFRCPRAAGHAKGVAVQRSLMPAIEVRKGRLIALGSTPQQNVVAFA
jgi:hypothetical protein